MNIKFKFLVIGSVLLLSTGCVAAFIAGAAAGGLIVADQRDIRAINDDSFINHQLRTHFIKDRAFRDSHILSANFNRVVLLIGQTPYPQVKALAERIARSTPSVSNVINAIQIRQPTTLTTRSKDSLITSDVKARMLATSGLRSGSIKVITEDSTVYLMGYVSRPQAEIAVDVARRVNGVRKVVKIFQYS